MAFDANDLSPHEHFVVERTNAGEIADFSAMGGPGGTKPAVRAGFLRKLLLRLDPSWAIRTPGVRIRGARIEGVLDLTDCSGEGLPALALVECEIPETVDLSHARLARVSFEGSRMTRLVAQETCIAGEFNFSNIAPLDSDSSLYVRARRIVVHGDVVGRKAKLARTHGAFDMPGPDVALSLSHSRIDGNAELQDLDVFGGLSLEGAQLGGSLRLGSAQILNRTDDGNGNAIFAPNAQIAGNLFVDDKFSAEGRVNFSSARVSGIVSLVGAQVRNGGGGAVYFVSAEIDGEFRAIGCKLLGELVVDSSIINGTFDLSLAEISAPIGTSSQKFGRAISGTSVEVSGALLLRGANIKGEIFIPDARIGGYLAMGAGRFINGGSWAVRAPNARVGGNLSFELGDGVTPHGQKTVIEGGLKLDRSRIEGALKWSQLELRGPGPDGAKGAVFSFADAQIAGPVQAKALTTQQDAFIDASGATCSALDDDVKTGWGAESARLCLDGFAYGRIDSDGEKWRSRLGWLKRSRRDGEKFSPQPFTHAASTYARMGRREDARRVQLAQHDLRTFAGSAGPFSWALSSLFGVIAGYGLAPVRVVRALALFLALGVFGVLAMNAQGALVTPQGRACNGAVEPTLYALDVALPVIDLGQESQCAPGRTARAELSPGVAVSETSDWRWLEGVAMWRWAHALYAMLGAILTALAIVTFSGIMKPKDE